MGINISQPGSGIPCHKHTDEEEGAPTASKGHGKLVMGTGRGIRHHARTAFWNPVGVEHNLYNIGDGPLKGRVGLRAAPQGASEVIKARLQ